MSNISGRVLVYGGKGALGSTIVNYFKTRNWWVASIDMGTNDNAHANVIVQPSDSLDQQENEVLSSTSQILEGNKVDAVICVAGGWAGGNIAAKDCLSNATLMWKQSVWTSLIAAKVASKYMKEGGLLTLTGAQAALNGTPGMIGYGIAKSAVHQLTKSLSAQGSGLPSNAKTIAILPVTLDTPMNRKFMPKADFSTWTPLEFVAELLLKWVTGDDVPGSGSLVQLITTNGVTDLKVA